MEFFLIGDPRIPTFGNILIRKESNGVLLELLVAANVILITVLILKSIQPKNENNKK
jgi:hypothetical protein